jgi:hypothetical protein
MSADCWDVGDVCFVPFTHCFDKTMLIRDHKNTCVKNKDLKSRKYYTIYVSSFLTWTKFLGA